MIVTAFDFEERQHEERVCDTLAAMVAPTVDDAVKLAETR